MTSFVEVDGLRIRVERAGAGHPVLLLHGWGASAEAMRMIAEDLARNYDVAALDFPGHGKSSPPPEPWRVSNFTALTLKVMDQLGLKQPHVIAHSFGGRVVIKLAAENPQRISRLVLTGAAGLPPERTHGQRARLKVAGIGKRVKRTLGDTSVSRWLESRWVHHVASADYQAASGTMRGTLVNIVAEDLSDWLPRIEAPTLLIWGAEDRDTPLSSGQRMAALIPSSELVVLEGGGHFAYAEQYSKFRLHLQRFLRESA